MKLLVIQGQAYVLMLLVQVDPGLVQYETAVSDGMDWLISQQKTNGAWQFSSVWQSTTEHPQVVAEAMAALSRAATALGM